MVYLFLFSWFNPEEEVTQHRALAWQSIHLPLHLGILLLMAAMVVRPRHTARKSCTLTRRTLSSSFHTHMDLILWPLRFSDRPFLRLPMAHLSAPALRVRSNDTSTSWILNRSKSKCTQLMIPLRQISWDTESSYLSTLVNVTQPSGRCSPLPLARDVSLIA